MRLFANNTKSILATNNILYHPETELISGLLDFDFTLVSHPYHEFASSFSTMNGNLRDEKFAAAILASRFENPPPSSVDSEEWDLAKEWSWALVVHGAQMLSSMKGIEGLRRLSSFESLLCPVSLYYPFLLKMHKPEELPKMRAASEKQLSDFLAEEGY
jgi:hypothetical protein